MSFRCGLYGGCFNPVHNGHLAVARAAMTFLQLDQLIFIPSGQPPMKARAALLPGTHRLAMLQLALAAEQGMSVSAVEISRAGPSFTVDTVKTLRADMPEDAALFFILGSDCLDRLPHWKGIDALHSMLRFAIVQRPGAERALLDPRLIDVPMAEQAISSSLIRQKVAAGQSLAGLVPQAVESYVQQHSLYNVQQEISL